MNMRPAIGTLGAALWLAAGVAPAATPEVQWVPVPPDLIQGSRFVAPAWNVSVEAPTGEWRWFYTPEPTGTSGLRYQAVACRSPEPGVQFVVSAFQGHHGDLDAKQAEDMARGSAKAFQNGGWTTKVVSTTGDAIPLPGSYRYVLEARQGDATVHVYTYIAAKGRLFVFQNVSSQEDEPHQFRRFVETFRFVGPAVPDPVEQLGILALSVTCGLTLLLGGCGWIANRLAGRVVVNLWYVAIAALLAVGVAFHLFVAPRVSRIQSPSEQGRQWGELVGGPVLWPGLFAIWRARAVARRRAAEREVRLRSEDVFS